MNIHKAFLFSVILSLSIFLIIYSPKIALKSDFISYYTAGSIIKDGKGTLLYSIPEQIAYEGKLIDFRTTNVLPFRYLPFVALIFVPFTYIPYITSFLLFSGINLVILLGYIFAAKNTFRRLRRPIFVLMVILLYVPNLQTVIYGQISLILSLFVLFLYQLLKNQRSFLAGLLAGLMIIKIQYIILVPFLLFLVKNKLRFLGGLAVSVGLLLLLSLLVTGFDGLMKYPSFLIQTERPEFSTWYWHSFTLYSFIRALPIIGQQNLLIQLIINGLFYIGFLIFYIKNVNKKEIEKFYSIAIIATILFSVHALRQDLTLLMTPILIFLNLARDLKEAPRKIVLIQASLLFLLFCFLALSVSLLGEFNWSALILIWVLWTVFRLDINLKLKDPVTPTKKDHVDSL